MQVLRPHTRMQGPGNLSYQAALQATLMSGIPVCIVETLLWLLVLILPSPRMPAADHLRALCLGTEEFLDGPYKLWQW